MILRTPLNPLVTVWDTILQSLSFLMTGHLYGKTFSKVIQINTFIDKVFYHRALTYFYDTQSFLSVKGY